MRLDVAHQTSSGNRYGTLNQDYALSAKIVPFIADAENEEGPPCYIAAVLDGHGMLGEISAERAGVALKEFLLESQLQHRVLKEMEKEEDGVLAIANVGDSLAALGSVGEDGFEGEGIAMRHYGLNEDESARVLTSSRLHSVQLSQADGYLRVTQGIWSGHSLAVTRALGHKHLEKFGVSHVPTVSILTLGDEHCCVVLGTDGLWDGLELGEGVRLTMDIMTMGGTAGEAAHELVEGAETIGYTSGNGDDVDNTTAVVMVWRVPTMPDS